MMEYMGETGGELRELFGHTELRGFENCEAISTENLAGYINEVIPPIHLTGCPKIEYDPNNSALSAVPTAGGVYIPPTHEIFINDNNWTGRGMEGILGTITHEIGHNAHSWLETNYPDIAGRWNAIHVASHGDYAHTGMGFVSHYATTNIYEDFAETYQNYIRNPVLLQVMAPHKYAFMRDWVFHGVQYAPNASMSAKTQANFDRHITPVLGAVVPQEIEGNVKANITTSGSHDGASSTYRCFDIIG